jgi:drug/metabolite transporter (DMT)-like permease
VVILAWGSNYALMKVALADISPLAFTALRLLGASVVVAAMLALSSRRLWPEPSERLPLALVGMCQVAGTLGLSILGLQWVSAGRAAVLVYTMPLWTVPLNLLLFRQWPTPRKFMGTLVGIAGLVVFFNPTLVDRDQPHAVAGHALLLAAAALWALGACVYARRRWASSFEAQTLWQLLLSTLPLAGAVLATGDPRVHWTPALLAILIYNWIVATALAYWCWSRVLAVLPAATAGQAVMVTPVVGYGLSAVMLGDPIGADVIASIALISAGLYLTLRSPVRASIGGR